VGDEAKYEKLLTIMKDIIREAYGSLEASACFPLVVGIHAGN
jgi:hypothetical protein